MFDLVAIVLLFLSGIALTVPFVQTPPDDHIADPVAWAMFREPGARLPEYYAFMNQGGFTRMFLYYLFEAIVAVTGKKNIVHVYRYLVALLVAISGVLLYVISAAYLDVSRAISLFSGFLFLFTLTRPQFEVLKCNPEIFEIVGELIGVLLLLFLWPENGGSYWVLLLPFTWLFFVGLNCKISYCVSAGGMAAGAFIVSGWSWQIPLVVCVAGLIALGLFFSIFKNTTAGHFKSIFRYLERMHAGSLRDNFVANYHYFLNKTPFAGLTFLLLALMLLPLEKPFYPIIAIWMAVTVWLITLQKRLSTYLFLTAIPPVVLVITLGIEYLYEVHPVILVPLMGGFLFLIRRSLSEFPYYYKRRSYKELVNTIYDPEFVWATSYDFRNDGVVEHWKQHPGDFMVWETSLLPHVMTGKAPVVLVASMTFGSYHMWVERLPLLVKAMQEKKPQWIYDYCGSFAGQNNLNILSLYYVSGLGYSPTQRVDNVLYYQLRRNDMPLWKSRISEVKLYVRTTVARDTFEDQLAEKGRGDIPDAFQRDLFSICMDLMQGHLCDKWDIDATLEKELISEPGTAVLYLVCNKLCSKEFEEAIRMLRKAEENISVMTTLYPALGVPFFGIQLLAGVPEEQCVWPDEACLSQSQVHEAFRQAKFIEALLESALLSEGGKDRLRKLIRTTKPSKNGAYYKYSQEYNMLLKRLAAAK